MTQDEVIESIPRNKKGEPKNDRLKDIAAMLLHYKYNEAELGFFAAEIEMFNKKQVGEAEQNIY